MEPSKINEQILKALFKKFSHASNKAMSMKQISVGFERIDAVTFFDTVAVLIGEGPLQYTGQGFIPHSAGTGKICRARVESKSSGKASN